MPAHAVVTLAVDLRGVRVEWRLDDVRLVAGEPLCELALVVAGAPTVRVDGELSATDEAGMVPLVASVAEGGDGGRVRRWSVDRSTSGVIEVSYLAEPFTAEPRPAAPPVELRREGVGLSGALKCFLALPAGPEDLTFELRWIRPGAGDGSADRWVAVSSLGEGDGDDGELAGTGLELLGDTYVMCGDLADHHHRDGQLSTWWLTSPGIDVEAFSQRLGATYRVMSEAFDAPAHPYRVFLRTHPHRGAVASTHPASFVIALNPTSPVGEGSLYQTIAHELVHEWRRPDGTAEDVTWFVEGSADYYSLVLPLRAGMLSESAFLDAVNFSAREAYASVRRHLSMREAQRVVSVLDVGLNPATWVTGRVQGLVTGGAADRAGLREGGTIDLPSYPEIVRMNVGDDLHIDFTRDRKTTQATIPLTGETAPVPQWIKMPTTGK